MPKCCFTMPTNIHTPHLFAYFSNTLNTEICFLTFWKTLGNITWLSHFQKLKQGVIKRKNIRKEKENTLHARMQMAHQLSNVLEQISFKRFNH